MKKDSFRPDFEKHAQNLKSIEISFPSNEISQLAEKESWRKEINRPIYHIHKWWATRLGSVFRAILLGALLPSDQDIWKNFYIRHDFKDKVVLDPFMGSGTTLGEALKLGAKVIGSDINPVSTFLVQQALTRISENDLRLTFLTLEQSIASEIRHYYQTRDPLTGEIIPVLYYFWVKIIQTPHGETIPLFSSYIFSKDAYPNKKPRAQIVCPACWNIIEGRFDTTEMICPSCQYEFNPQIGPAQGQYVVSRLGERYKIKDLIKMGNKPPDHFMYAIMALRPNGEKIYLPVSDFDKNLYRDCVERLKVENLPLPSMVVREGYNTDQARGYNYLLWSDFFNVRQLLCLGLLLREILKIGNEQIRDQFICLFSSTLEFNNLFCTYKGEGTGAVRPIFSNHILKPERIPLENSVWGISKSSGTFSKLFESRLLPAKRYLDDPFDLTIGVDKVNNPPESSKVTVSNPMNVKMVNNWHDLVREDKSAIILNGDSGSLNLPDGVIDAIITDPPYFDFVHYSELSDFFFAWLSNTVGDRYPFFQRENSSHLGEVQHRDALIFSSQLSNVFSECNRILKDDGLLVFSFHHSRPEGWAAIYDALTKAGFSIRAAHPVHAELKAATPKSATKEPISLDAILVCKKNNGAGDMGSIDIKKIKEKIDEMLQHLNLPDRVLSNTD